MAGAGDEDHILVILFDNAVQVDVDEVLAGHGAPVADDLFFHILAGERAAQQRIVQQIQLAGCQVVGRAPVGVDAVEFGFVHETSSLPWIFCIW